MAEVGCWTGISTKLFARYFTMIYAVDPWSNEQPEIASEHNMAEVEKIFDQRVNMLKSVIKVKATSAAAVQGMQDNSLDLVYIDALHAYEHVKEDLKLWRYKVRRGGFLCGHDYSKKFPGVMRALEEFRGTNFKLFPDTSWVVKL